MLGNVCIKTRRILIELLQNHTGSDCFSGRFRIFTPNNKSMKRFAISILILLYGMAAVQAQTEQAPSIHQEQLEQYKNMALSPEDWQRRNEQELPAARPKTDDTCRLQKRVFGWHPYWSNGLESQYNWKMLSDLSYFAYEVNATTGMALNTYSWSSAAVVNQALAQGVRVHLCATLFSNHATFFGSPTARQTLINNLITLVQQRGAHGVNIDFEAVPAAQSANLTEFIIALGTQLHAAIPGAELSIALPAVDWSTVFNVSAMNPYVDIFIIMGYDYYWSGSSQAGPTDPLYSFGADYDRNHSRSISYYLHAGVPREKLLLGLPYYGREWETVSNQAPANTTGAFHSSRTYKTVRDNSATYSQGNYHPASTSNYYVYPSGSLWRQCFINSEHTLGRRYQQVQQRGLAGIGIWALGYDAGYEDLWNLIRDNFSTCAMQACADTLYDSGGPAWNYYHNENTTYTIAPPGATSLSVQFHSFQLENGYDTLWIYDGSSTAAPLIGAFTASNSPGAIQASGGSLTFRFRSDVGVSAPGWMATYECSTINSTEESAAGAAPLRIFPNPASDEVTVEYAVVEPQTVRIDLYDATGRVLHSRSQMQESGQYQARIALPAVSGPLWLRVRIGEKYWTKCVVKR